MKAAGYARVSTEEQAKGGYSLPAQRRAIAAYCRAKGWQLVDVFVDAGASGKDLRRPGLRDLLTLCDAGGCEVVVVAAMDRLSRRLGDLDHLREAYFDNGVALALLREGIDCTTPTGKAMFRLVATFAELERDLLRERTRSGMAEAKRAGHIAGVVPFGWRREGGALVKDPEQQRALRKAKRLRREGSSLRAIAARLGWGLKATTYRLGWRPPAKHGRALLRRAA